MKVSIFCGVMVVGLALVSLGAMSLEPFPVSGNVAESAELPVRHLRVGLENYYPPMAFTGEDGQTVGFDMDITQAICKQLEAECALVVGAFDVVLEKMMKGELDMMVASLAANDQRKPHMDFTDHYYRSRTIYIGKPGIEISAEGLRGKRLGAEIGTMQHAYLKRQWLGIAEILDARFEALLDKLVHGEVDVVLADALVCYDFLKGPQGKPFDILGDPLNIDNVLSHARIGIRKGDAALLADVNKAITSLRLNGEYDRITRKYFAFSIY